MIYCEVLYLNNNLISKIFKRLQLITSSFSDPTLLLIFAQFLISFLTVFNVNTFEEKNFFSYGDTFRSVKYPRRATSWWI